MDLVICYRTIRLTLSRGKSILVMVPMELYGSPITKVAQYDRIP